MKTTKFSFYALGAALMLTAASCSSDLPVAERGEVYNGPTDSHFLRLNIVSGNEASTRATADENGVYTDGDAQYKDGNQIENAVNSLRIYFFNADETAANVINTAGAGAEPTFTSYLDFNKQQLSEALTPDDDNVEKVISPVLLISTARGDELPYSIVAVVNPPTGLGEVESIEDLNTKVGNYTVVATGATDDPGFVMTNSIYADGQNVMEAVEVASHMSTDQALAMANPATVYVERVNAKIEVTIDGDLSETATEQGTSVYYPTGVKYKYASTDEEWEGDTDQIYVELLGWSPTCTTNQSYLMKHISPSWTNQGLFGSQTATDWNSPTRYRSFWAYNPTLYYDPAGLGNNGNNYLYGDFEAAQAIKGFGQNTTVNYAYLQENAGLSAENPATAHPTQLIVAGRLCDSKGNSLTLAEYGGLQFTVDGLKGQMASMSNIYVKNGNAWQKISGDNIEFITATEAGVTSTTPDSDVVDPAKPGRYFVYANLVEGDYEYGQPNAEGTVETVSDISSLNAWLIQNVKRAKIWETGSTYYYVNIRHFGRFSDAMEVGEADPDPATWGVVRNHIYQLNLSGIVGLGTPVFDEDEIIYPEHPEDDDTFIAAKINILNWRLVPQNVSFVW